MTDTDELADAFLAGYEQGEMAATAIFYHIRQPKTNYDRIRSMTVEELAGGIISIMQWWCPNHASDCKSTCRECLIDWLKEEVKE